MRASIAHDLKQINFLQKSFNKRLGQEDKPLKLLNYNPVLARWKFEQTQTPEQRDKFKQYETFQVETTLRERNHAAKSAVTYSVGEDGELYNELFPDEPFTSVLERGLAYRRENGSKELMREESEVDGWQKISQNLKNPETPTGTKAIVISGPGLIEDTNYHDNFVDIYEAVDDPSIGRRSIRMVRYASSLDYEQYWEKLQRKDVNYFQETNRPIDAWLLSHPLFMDASGHQTADQIFDSLFERRRDSMSELEFQSLLVMCMPVINYYINELTKKDYNPENIALSWNAVLQKNDISKRILRSGKDLPLEQPLFNGNVGFEVDWLGRQIIETVAAGCGASEGFETSRFGLTDPIVKIQLSNSVAKFAYDTKKNNERNAPETLVDEHGKLIFDCPNKNNKEESKKCTPGVITRPPHILLPACPHCGTALKC